MGCSSRKADPDAGYVTTVGAALSFVFALAATALIARAGVELRGARADLVRAQDEYRLDGLHRTAVAVVIADPAATRLKWRQNTAFGPAEFVAESESRKLALGRAGEALDDGLLRAMGVADPQRLRDRVKAAALPGAAALRTVLRLDAARAWRACAPSLLSPYGGAERLEPIAAKAPTVGQPNWRVGELWRIRVSLGDRTDERIVRLTGDPQDPAAVVERDVSRTLQESYPCDHLTDAIKPG